MRKLRLVSAIVLVAGSVALAALPAAATPRGKANGHFWDHGQRAQGATCTGTLTAPGVLSGSYSGNVTVSGFCLVNQGASTVPGNVTVLPGSALVAAFGLDDLTGSGNSSLSVGGNLFVRDGATLLLGCEPFFFTCLDDPNAMSGGTLTSNGSVGGSILSTNALAVVVHASQVGGNIQMIGGGFGNSCATPAVSPSNTPSLDLWATIAMSAPYGDVEDTTVGGALQVKQLVSCWLGAARDTIGQNLQIMHNTLNDPDAIEIISNHVSGNLACFGNTMTWDSSEASFGQVGLYPRTPGPNTVGGNRLGQCVLSSPATPGGPLGPGPF